MKFKVIALWCLCSVMPVKAQEFLSPLVTDFEQHFQAVLAEQDIPGGAYAIVYKDQIIRAGGFGVREKGSEQPVDPYTVFRIASVSKTFAAGLASILASRGHFKWDEAVTHYIPDFAFKSNQYTRQLKIEHLLSQSTGVMPNAYDNMIEANMLPERILPHFKKLDPMCQPGQCYGYQNVLFSLIEPIMQQTTHSDYASLLQQNIFKPLQLPTASVGLEAFLNTENRAMPHVKALGHWRNTQVQESYYRFAAAAGVNASAMDLGYWLIAQLGYKPDVLSTDLLQQITSKRVKTRRDLRRKEWRNYLTDAYYALGWRVYQFGEEELVYHGGWVQGFRADIAYSRQRELGLVILLNAETSMVNELSTYFWSSMFTAFQQQDQHKDTVPELLLTAAE